MGELYPSRTIYTCLLLACTILNQASCNLDIFFVQNNKTQDLVYKGTVDPRFKRQELKSTCPANPTYVVDFPPNSTHAEMYIVTQEKAQVTIKDTLATGEVLTISASPHQSYKVDLNYTCNQDGWKKKQLFVDYKAEGNASLSKEYSLLFHVNCHNKLNHFDMGMGFICLAAILVAMFGAAKDRPTGALATSFIRDTTTVNLSKAIVWVIGLTIVMMLVSYFGIYMDITLAIFYGLVGLITMQLVMEDVLVVLLPNKLNGTVYKKIKTRDVVAFLVSLVVGILYAWKRHWLLNNIIAVCTGISLISMIEIRTFRFGVFFFLILFLIDLLWLLHVIPKSDTRGLYKHQGQDINAPFKLLIPRLQSSPYTSCARIGLGDIIVPAMMMRFLRLFDKRRDHLQHQQMRRANSNPIIPNPLTPVASNRANQHYFIVSLLTFAGVLIIWTFGHMFWTKSYPPQLYLCPSILIAIVGLALHKKELNELWTWVELENRHVSPDMDSSIARPVGASRNAGGPHTDDGPQGGPRQAGGYQYLALRNNSDGE